MPSHDTPRVQEVQILVLHLLCELVENAVHDAPTLSSAVNVVNPPRAAGILAGTPLGTD